MQSQEGPGLGNPSALEASWLSDKEEEQILRRILGELLVRSRLKEALLHPCSS